MLVGVLDALASSACVAPSEVGVLGGAVLVLHLDSADSTLEDLAQRLHAGRPP